MPSLTSQLIVSLIDKVSAPAKGAAASLKGVDAAAKSIGTAGAKNAQNLVTQLDKIAAAKKRLSEPFKGLDLSKEFKGLRLTSRELQLVTKDFEALRGAMRGMKASDALGIFGTWKSRTVADLREMRAEMAATEKSRERMMRGWRGGVRFAAGAAGVGGTAYLANRAGRGTINAAAGNAREGAKDFLAGLTSEDTARLHGKGLTLSGKFPSVDGRTMHESMREAASSMRSIDKAFEIGDVMARGLVVLQSLKGKDQALDESRKFFKALDNLGKNLDPDEVKSLYDGFIRATGVEGSDMNMGDMFTAAKLAKSAGPGMSNRFLMSVAPSLIQDMGASRFGTAMGSMQSQVIGGRATAQSKAAQQQYGLRDKKGRFIDGNLLMSDPDLYLNKRLIPEMQKRKVNIDDPLAVAAETAKLFSNQVVADIITKLITQRQQYEGKGKQYDLAPGTAGAEKLREKDPFVAFEGVMAQLRNSASELAEGPLKSAVGLMNAFTDSIASFNETLRNNPQLKDTLGTGGAIVGGAAAVGTAGLLARKGYRWLFDKAPIGGGGSPGGTAAPRGSFLGGVGNALKGGATALGPAYQMATQPDMLGASILDGKLQLDKPRGWWTDQFVQPFWERMRNGPKTLPNRGRVSAWHDQYSRDTGRITGMSTGAPGAGFADGWGKGANPIVDAMNKASEAGAAGQQMATQFSGNLSSGVEAGLKTVDAAIAAAIQRWIGMINSVNITGPTINPRFGTPAAPASAPAASPAAPLRSSAIDLLNIQHATLSDATNFGNRG